MAGNIEISGKFLSQGIRKIPMKRILIILILILICKVCLADNWLGRDKAAHFISCGYLTCYSYGIGKDVLEMKDDSSRILGLGLSLSAGLLKEYYDVSVKGGEWSWKDVFWDSAGICLGIVLINNLR